MKRMGWVAMTYAPPKEGCRVLLECCKLSLFHAFSDAEELSNSKQ